MPKQKKEKHIINCDKAPFVPEGWSVEDHQKGGQLLWSPAKVALFLADAQKTGRIGGHDLRKILGSHRVLNANVLDYLLANPSLIPEEWKGKYVYFWGTIYRDRDGSLYVRYLCWDGGRWSWNYYWLGNDWCSTNPAAVLARSSKKLKPSHLDTLSLEVKINGKVYFGEVKLKV